MKLPEDLQYTDHNEWVRLDGEGAVIGITDFLASQLGPVTRVELPVSGRKLRNGEPVVLLRSALSSHVIVAPISGHVMTVNSAIAENPATVNNDPYQAGWLFKIRIEAGEEIEHLRDVHTYAKRVAAAEVGTADSP